jgi:hypothetical protein
MELELNYADGQCAQIASQELGQLGYLKEDCSLADGFEIVTHPMTHEYASESFPWSMLRDLRCAGADADGAGMHVHVNRDAFDGPAHVYRWMQLIYRNADGVSGVARRRSYEWASFSHAKRPNLKASAKGDRDGERYSAINVQNWATFEVRVFAASLDTQEVRAALDLVAASVEYTRHLTVPVILAGGWTWDAFRTWVDARPEYSALSEEMTVCAS